jgi:hypothetical protein
MIEDLMSLYTDQPVMSANKKCIIMQNKLAKIVWDIWILVLLLVISTIVPYRLAFSDQDSVPWITLYSVADTFFFIDIIVTFFTSVTDDQKIYEITDHRIIARKYLKGWFWIDVISILPLDLILLSEDQQATVLARFAKIGKLYKLIRMIRLAKVLKLLKSKNTVMTQFTQKMRINAGKERLIFFTVFFLFFFHISTCMFIYLGELDNDMSSWMWDSNYYLMDD